MLFPFRPSIRRASLDRRVRNLVDGARGRCGLRREGPPAAEAATLAACLVAATLSLSWAQAAAATAREPAFAFEQNDHEIAVTLDGRPVGTYVFRDAKIPRPYWTRLAAADGTQVTRNHPPVPGADPTDHDTIHPGMWLAFGDLNGTDFWRNRGRIEHLRFVRDPKLEGTRFSFAVEDRYLAVNGSEICRGTTEFCLVAGESPGTTILVATELRAEAEPLVLGPQHEMGLGIRVATPLAVKDGSGAITASHGGRNEAGTWGRPGTWWDYGGLRDGKRAGILVAAGGPGARPVWAHSRDYGFLALNPTDPPRRPDDSEPTGPVTVARGDALRLRFAIALYSRPATEAWSAEAAGRAVAAALDAWSPGAIARGTPPATEIAAVAGPDTACPYAVTTFECAGLYWDVKDGGRDQRCAVKFREEGRDDWRAAQDLWFDATRGQYRGSVVNLRPETTYEFALRLPDGREASVRGRTWSNAFPIASTTVLPGGVVPKTVRITEGGTPAGYRLYVAAPEGTTIDVADADDTCLSVEAPYVIVRGVTCRGARIHGLCVANQSHVVIEGCDISGWGRPDPQAGQTLRIAGQDHRIPARLGFYLDSGIRVRGPDAERIVIQGNHIHHPRFTSNNWTQVSPYFSQYGTKETHPQGPDAITFDEITRGRHVIRWNDVDSDFDHMFYDAILAAEPKGNGFVCDGDIYGNRISHCWDDGIEAERGERNVRIWGNHFSKMIKCISAGFIWNGPLYIYRNVAEDLICTDAMPGHNGGQSLFRGHPPTFMPPPQEDPAERRDGVVFVYHNTLLPGVEGSVGTAAGWAFSAWHRFKYATPTVRLVSRNNVWITRPYEFYLFAPNPTTRNFVVRDFDRSYFDQDHDLHNGTIDPPATAGRHTLECMPRFRAGHGAGSAGLYQLEPDTPGADDAVRLPNFSDDFQGAGPDRGMHEGGTEPMRFGRVLWKPAS